MEDLPRAVWVRCGAVSIGPGGLRRGVFENRGKLVTKRSKAEQRAFVERDLFGVDYVYLWADDTHVNVRLEEHKLCLLVVLGVRADGRKELVSLAVGEARIDGILGRPAARCRGRGMTAPVPAIRDRTWGSGARLPKLGRQVVGASAASPTTGQIVGQTI
jgi:hypothetical protein